MKPNSNERNFPAIALAVALSLGVSPTLAAEAATKPGTVSCHQGGTSGPGVLWDGGSGGQGAP
jgi:hypothetical protein